MVSKRKTVLNIHIGNLQTAHKCVVCRQTLRKQSFFMAIELQFAIL